LQQYIKRQRYLNNELLQGWHAKPDDISGELRFRNCHSEPGTNLNKAKQNQNDNFDAVIHHREIFTI